MSSAPTTATPASAWPVDTVSAGTNDVPLPRQTTPALPSAPVPAIATVVTLPIVAASTSESSAPGVGSACSPQVPDDSFHQQSGSIAAVVADVAATPLRSCWQLTPVS